MSNQSKYDESFRKNAVGLVASGQKISQVAHDLGLHAETLYSWVRKYRKPEERPATPARSGAATELDTLRKENELLRMERDILKKAVGIFSRPPR